MHVYLLLAEGLSVIVNGDCIISQSVSLRLTKDARLVLGNHVVLGDSVKVMIEPSVHIGDYTFVTFDSKIIDTNFHYIVDLETKTISRKNKPIIIGANNWIGNAATVMKGTQTGPFTIIASGSMINKDFSSEYNVTLAGTPAKVVKGNQRRLFRCDGEFTTEKVVDKYFSENPNAEIFEIS